MREGPIVLCLTNTVAANFTANCLLAVGARPTMIEEPCEAEELARVAGDGSKHELNHEQRRQ